MSMVRLILKEVGGRMQNAAGSINADGNMYKGASGKAPSDKLLGGATTRNPIAASDKGTSTGIDEEVAGDSTVSTDEKEADAASDERLKDSIQISTQDIKYIPSGRSNISGILKNLELDPTKAKKKVAVSIAGQSSESATGSTADSADNATDAADSAGDISGAASAAG